MWQMATIWGDAQADLCRLRVSGLPSSQWFPDGMLLSAAYHGEGILSSDFCHLQLAAGAGRRVCDAAAFADGIYLNLFKTELDEAVALMMRIKGAAAFVCYDRKSQMIFLEKACCFRCSCAILNLLISNIIMAAVIIVAISERSQRRRPRRKGMSEKRKPLPRLLFAAPASGSGKTIITCGLLEIFKRRKLACVSYKCGPDYIDPLFHQYVLGIPGYNLDSFFLPPEQVRELFEEKAQGADIAVVEGVMGYYDGVGGISVQASAYEIARITDTPVVLVVDGKSSSLSLAAVVKGFLEYKKDNHICGVILNRTSAAMAERLRPCLEQLGIRLYGAVPLCEEARWESRHLGLALPGEQAKLRERVQALADQLESCLDVGGLLELAESAPLIRKRKKQQFLSEVKNIRRIAVARDEAFCFYYQENLDLLKQQGWELVPFSPLHDKRLPCPGISAILLGGGYPEMYAKGLSENKAMLEELRTAGRQGIKMLAECGGFLYLHEMLEGTDHVCYPMVGLIPAKGYRTEKRSRFGYITLYDQKGQKMFQAHEFHYWDSTLPGKDWKAVKPLSAGSWDCMYVTDTIAAGFPHLYYNSNPEWICRFLQFTKHDRK